MTRVVAAKKNRVVRTLLDWYRVAARDLPWRHTRDPYAIWVSEIMLQQTQVKTVIPYWIRWMESFPNPQALARASQERVLKHWEGLGYYRRARHLHQAAQIIVDQHRGEFPRDHARILALPGIGRYTAGAIQSIAFDRPVPILDGNVTRVLARLWGIDANTREASTQTLLWNLSEKLVRQADQYRPSPAARGGEPRPVCSHLNQALMELGATVCLPANPACPQCPVSRHCAAKRDGLIGHLPRLPQRAATTARYFLAVVWQTKDRVLMRQRRESEVNAGLWEFPALEVPALDLAHAKPWLRQLGLRPSLLQPGPLVRHAITRYRISVQAYWSAHRPPREIPPQGTSWIHLTDVEQLALTSAHRKIWRRYIQDSNAD